VSGRASPVGFGLYFIDVLACLLFCIVLTLVGARFSRETTVPVELPELAGAAGLAGVPEAVSLTIREEAAGTRFYLEDEPLSFEALGRALRAEPPAALRIRAEETALARVIGLAHESGVHDIELAYETRARDGARGGP
jgi:biopolymer transport protein ExbD